MDAAIKSLVSLFIQAAMFGPRFMQINAEWFLKDRRSRRKIWKQLQAEGYVTVPPGEDDNKGVMTFKAFDLYFSQATQFDLATKYTFDDWSDRKSKGNSYVIWDRLSLLEQVFVIGTLRMSPGKYTLLAFDRYSDGSKFQTFELGNADAAVDAIGASNAVLAVTDAGVKAKRDAGAIAHRKAECEKHGLNWFLQKQGVFNEGEELPTSFKPLIFQSGDMALKPSEWPAEVPAAIQGIKDQMSQLQKRMALLERLEAHVEKVGGWTKFLENYKQTIDEFVQSEVATGKLKV